MRVNVLFVVVFLSAAMISEHSRAEFQMAADFPSASFVDEGCQISFVDYTTSLPEGVGMLPQLLNTKKINGYQFFHVFESGTFFISADQQFRDSLVRGEVQASDFPVVLSSGPADYDLSIEYDQGQVHLALEATDEFQQGKEDKRLSYVTRSEIVLDQATLHPISMINQGRRAVTTALGGLKLVDWTKSCGN